MPSGRVAVSPSQQFRARRTLFNALGELFEVEFVPRDTTRASRDLDGAIILGSDGEESAWPPGTTSLLFVSPTEHRQRGPASVALSDSELLDSRIRRHAVRGATVSGAGLGDWRGETLATCEGLPVWQARTAGTRRVDRVVDPPAELERGESLGMPFGRLQRRCSLSCSSSER